MLALLVAGAFVPVAAIAEVSNSRGSKYRVETCFRGQDDLVTRFVYPDRTAVLTIAGGKIRVTESGKPDKEGGDGERRFAFGHNFHAIALNAQRWLQGDAYALPFGGSVVVLATENGLPSKMRFEGPDTTPVELSFSDWRGQGPLPYRLELRHAGVTYDYRYSSVDKRCGKAS